MDFYGFYMGQEFEAYRFLGAQVQGDGSVVFRTFAPNAASISVIGDFNSWQGSDMHKIYDGNFWELTVPQVEVGSRYKFRITSQTGKTIDHCDPYGFGSEKRPNTASVVHTLDSYSFRDGAWMDRRGEGDQQPLNIYEVHLGSWQRKSDAPDDWCTYEELAQRLIPYVKECGYNYVEFLPISEHPCDESWGYQITAFYAPTSRYGTARELMMLIDRLHQAGIGVILDFVPAHFAVDDYGLAKYDGTALYEYPHRDVEVSEWGSHNFMHSRGEVRSFLQSCARYWLEEFHFDGLRMDAISRILYWQGDEARGVNGDGVAFLRTMNQGLKRLCPGCILAAEDSTNFPKVTAPAEQEGLGFDYKWDMGWMNDTLDYFRTDPLFRGGCYHKLTFSMAYYYDSNYLLPLSHDEVVHGKATILQKMFGDYEMKFPQARAFYMYMYAHPGKKLNFMGNEIGHFREWDEKREQDWGLLTYPAHQDFHRFMTDLNHFYLEHPAFFEKDYDGDGFRWLDCHAEEQCIYAFERAGKKERIAAVFNFSGIEQANYKLEIPDAAGLRRLFTSERQGYGGSVSDTAKILKPDKGAFEFTLAPFSAEYYLIEEDD